MPKIDSVGIQLYGLPDRVFKIAVIMMLTEVRKLHVKVIVSQSCPTLWDPMDYIVNGILQARVLEWVAFPFSRGSSQTRDWTQVFWIMHRFFINWAMREAQQCINKMKISRKRLQKIFLKYQTEIMVLKNITTESVEVSWINLESLIQSVVSQKEK